MTMNYGLSPAEQAARRAAQRSGTAMSSGLGMNMGISPMSNLEMTRRARTLPNIPYPQSPQPLFSPAPPTVRAGAPINISGGLPPTSGMGTGGMPSAPIASGPISSNYGTLPFQPPYINVNYPPNNTLEKWGVRPEINSLWNRYRTGEMRDTLPSPLKTPFLDFGDPLYRSGQIPRTIPYDFRRIGNYLDERTSGVNPMEHMVNLSKYYQYPLPYGRGF